MATVTVTVTAKGQVTLRKEVLDHLQVRPGDRLEVDLLPSGRIEARAKPKRPITDLFGMLKREGEATHSIEEINEAIAGGWAGER
jgi:AbrB family looped-hinge helix DNA binding protein